ncbi:hypothetical protein FIBSPDRAFT_99435 [Athelia psychrophila]|uniref:Uncharacterized protein n=1 Tax=Athelia psychrophila TaxID=1759441 RepID=A0A166DLZ4_9AGAM|nr:hypothetical protein FIBSPDRAFT_99435 [Fibularhizoctonia sp. CBS 109695]
MSTATSHLPNPWLDNPLPTSVLQPNIEITLHKFNCHYIPEPGTYPYRLDTDGRDAAVHFYEMRGVGHTPRDAGYPGDVYVKVKPGMCELWAMLKIGEDGARQWVRWVPEEKEKIVHPHLKLRYLWCSTRGEVSWYSPYVFEALAKHENPNGTREAGELIAEMLRIDAERTLTSKRKDGSDENPTRDKRQKVGPTLDTGCVSTPTTCEKSPYAALSGSSGTVSPEHRIANKIVTPTTLNTPGSETTLREEALAGNPSKKKAFLDAHQNLITEIDQHQRDIRSHVDKIAKINRHHKTTSSTCQLLSDSNEKLGQRISALLSQQQALISLVSPAEIQREIGGNLPPEGPTSDELSQIGGPDKVLASRTISDMPMARDRSARFNQVVASFDDILYDLLKAEQSTKAAEQVHSAQMTSMLQKKENLRAELAGMTERRVTLEERIEKMKRAIAEC